MKRAAQQRWRAVVIVTPRVELATADDLEGLTALRLAQGWHASQRLLAALAEWEWARIFVVRDDKSRDVIATTAAIACDGVGVIGNVIVRADQQRRGLGRLVMMATLDWLRERGVRSALLDATVEGRPLYLKLGFVPYGISWFADGTLAGVRRTALRERAGDIQAGLRPAGELWRLAALDAAAFGGDRLGLLARMLEQPGAGLFIAEDAAGAPTGYTLVRPLEEPSVGVHIGPWVAKTAQGAAAAFAVALGEDAPWRMVMGEAVEDDGALHLSLPGTSAEALELCEALGLRMVEDDLLMQLDMEGYGQEPQSKDELRRTTEHPEWVFGWLAPMVF